MKRLIVYWKDNEPEQIILGTAREIKSLHNNLIKRYWSLYCTEPFAHPMSLEERTKMYGISLHDFGIMNANTVANIIATEHVRIR